MVLRSPGLAGLSGRSERLLKAITIIKILKSLESPKKLTSLDGSLQSKKASLVDQNTVVKGGGRLARERALFARGLQPLAF